MDAINLSLRSGNINTGIHYSYLTYSKLDTLSLGSIDLDILLDIIFRCAISLKVSPFQLI